MENAAEPRIGKSPTPNIFGMSGFYSNYLKEGKHMPKYFIKDPVEAIQYTGENDKEVVDWIENNNTVDFKWFDSIKKGETLVVKARFVRGAPMELEIKLGCYLVKTDDKHVSTIGFKFDSKKEFEDKYSLEPPTK